MNYFGRAIGSVSKTWNSINPATLSGAIDVVVVEQQDGELFCSPFHIRFGKFQLLRPNQKKVNFKVNDKLTNLPMKLGEAGEAYFVFQADNDSNIPNELITSPVVSASSSPDTSPKVSPASSPLSSPTLTSTQPINDSVDFFDINSERHDGKEDSDPSIDPPNIKVLDSFPEINTASIQNFETNKYAAERNPFLQRNSSPNINRSFSSINSREIALERARKLTHTLSLKNIPTKIESNGDLLLDINGYKSNEENIQNSDELIKKLLSEEFGNDYDLSTIMHTDEEGNIRIYSYANELNSSNTENSNDTYTTCVSPNSFCESTSSLDLKSQNQEHNLSTDAQNLPEIYYFKTIRLTSEQLKCLNLKSGKNTMQFTVDKTKATITSRIFLWKYNVPIVISDIDGTITKSDALGHVFTMIGRDWTHNGVAKLFTDIELNGYNTLYLTARSIGQADSTRSYLKSIEQGGISLPEGPVILSPDRLMAALKREIILKKPEVFKMACLNDLKNLYGNCYPPPFYAGFGNRITDALSYRSVNIPSSRIFTINPVGEVHMELLELAGYKSSYIHINELVDHFFPPVNIDNPLRIDERFTDLVFWRDPLPDLSDEESEGNTDLNKNQSIPIISDYQMKSFSNVSDGHKKKNKVAEEDISASINEYDQELSSEDENPKANSNDADYSDFEGEYEEEENDDDDDDGDDECFDILYSNNITKNLHGTQGSTAKNRVCGNQFDNGIKNHNSSLNLSKEKEMITDLTVILGDVASEANKFVSNESQSETDDLDRDLIKEISKEINKMKIDENDTVDSSGALNGIGLHKIQSRFVRATEVMANIKVEEQQQQYSEKKNTESKLDVQNKLKLNLRSSNEYY
ncbi:phosphatidate phosphatase PAH1 [Ascoidea rubescens DSM 1968]|uniref:LNS2-domain-containing protein n=1 Tax=Ascoidea rubescens DSM 1968 TaxID=1344418 RepID=A0A1D2VKT2_9ASCO|nr:LNS2-domain-containing protein [Ascoidea rubescens DSM 1968]ODV62147.1 LNS2-domain-containing protein [Ascoidea rubescens DSM 1968]